VKTLSLRAWLTLWYTITLVLVLALFGGDVLIEQQRLGIGRADQELDSVHATLATIFFGRNSGSWTRLTWLLAKRRTRCGRSATAS